MHSPFFSVEVSSYPFQCNSQGWGRFCMRTVKILTSAWQKIQILFIVFVRVGFVLFFLMYWWNPYLSLSPLTKNMSAEKDHRCRIQNQMDIPLPPRGASSYFPMAPGLDGTIFLDSSLIKSFTATAINYETYIKLFHHPGVGVATTTIFRLPLLHPAVSFFQS